MSLIKCPECGKDVSDTCEYCIHCGFKLSKPNFNEQALEERTVVLVNRANNIKIVKTLVWGIVLAFFATVTFLIIVLSKSAYSGILEFLILGIFISLPALLLSIMCFVLFGLDVQKAKLNNKITDPLVVRRNGTLVVYDINGNKYENGIKQFTYKGSELYAYVGSEKVFLGWMSDTREFRSIYNR